jgi:hypothetical protein
MDPEPEEEEEEAKPAEAAAEDAPQSTEPQEEGRTL